MRGIVIVCGSLSYSGDIVREIAAVEKAFECVPMSGTIELTPVDPEQFDRFIDAIVRMEPPQMPQKTLDGLLGRLDYLRQPVEFKAECEPPYERRSEAGQLRRENIWREKQARALFNARVNQERRKRKQMRGIGRR